MKHTLAATIQHIMYTPRNNNKLVFDNFVDKHSGDRKLNLLVLPLRLLNDNSCHHKFHGAHKLVQFTKIKEESFF